MAPNIPTTEASTRGLIWPYGMERPTSFLVLSVADHRTLELQVLFTKA